ncbi:MAG: 1-deoxy-D-xylulose-5-phosphate synthase [Pseudoflavonifractor sp.]|nr:1-deoxy-D-xylulose-5-phosphate synthase [Pseudoflavonifractor sp.]
MPDINLRDIHSPKDIKGMDLVALTDLAAQLRATLLKKLSAVGGHVGPNLGMLEAIIALHYVFDAPEDKIVFDVSHQSYVHKMLTGRIGAFLDPAHYHDVSGYTNPRESEYDLFSVGHTSTAVSLASGLAKARDVLGGHGNVVAVVGDGALSGGQAFEGLDYACTLGSNFIVVVNDNEMSIAENHGALYADLRLLRNTNGTAEPNYFRSLGYSYRYVKYGNDLRSLIEAFRGVKDIDHPVVVHINTMKGEGLPVAEANKEAFHYAGPFDLKTGAPAVTDNTEDYSDIFAEMMLERMHDNPNLVVLTAGTPGSLGFTPDRRWAAGRRFIDVGIAEQQAVSMTAGLSKGGAVPVMGVVGSFLQRAYDQMSQDVAINCQPSVFVLFYGGIYGIPDETHLGFFDIALFSNIPNLAFLAPTCKEEYMSMIDWAMTQRERPVIVRTPGGGVTSSPRQFPTDYSRPEYEVVERGSKVALIGAGTFFDTAVKAAALLKARGITPTVINPRILSALDTATLDSLRDYKLVVTMEDGIVDGGFGQKVAAYLGESSVEVKCLGLPKEFRNDYDVNALLNECSLTAPQVADIVTSRLSC